MHDNYASWRQIIAVSEVFFLSLCFLRVSCHGWKVSCSCSCILLQPLPAAQWVWPSCLSWCRTFTQVETSACAALRAAAFRGLLRAQIKRYLSLDWAWNLFESERVENRRRYSLVFISPVYSYCSQCFEHACMDIVAFRHGFVCFLSILILPVHQCCEYTAWMYLHFTDLYFSCKSVLLMYLHTI